MSSDTEKTPQAEPPRAKGPWLSRVAINVLTLVVGLLLFWLLGFVIDDIGSVRGPDYREIEERHLDASLVERDEVLSGQINDIARQVEKQNQRQRILSQSSQELQNTMGQLLDLQKISLEKELSLSAEQTQAFNDSLEVFLANQQTFQEINEEMATLVEQRQTLEDEQSTVRESLETQREPARDEYEDLVTRHRWRLALIKLAVLAPLFLIGAGMVVKMRGHSYFPLVVAFAGAVSFKMMLVMHQHFPQRWFKYILILVALLVAARLLVYFIRSIVAPQKDKLLKQYREAYEKFLCPVCEYPIRRGPMKYLYWNRRSLKKLRLPSHGLGEEEDDDPYTCPSCSTNLFSNCGACHAVRPTLLPYCEHCGASEGGD